MLGALRFAALDVKVAIMLAWVVFFYRVAQRLLGREAHRRRIIDRPCLDLGLLPLLVWGVEDTLSRIGFYVKSHGPAIPQMLLVEGRRMFWSIAIAVLIMLLDLLGAAIACSGSRTACKPALLIFPLYTRIAVIALIIADGGLALLASTSLILR